METNHYISKTSEVKHIMTKHLFLLNLKDPIAKASAMFKEYKIRHLPVMNGSKVVGMLSNTDLLRINFDEVVKKSNGESPFSDIRLEDVMRKNPTTVRENESIESVAKKLKEEDFHAVPVIDNEGIVGIVTTTDVIDFFMEGVDSKFNSTKNL